MTRWLLLLITMLTWMGSMLLVHNTYGPRPPSKNVLQNRSAMEAVFGERVDPRPSWRIFMNPEETTSNNASVQAYMNLHNLRQDLEKRRAQALKMGAEPGQIQIGTMLTKTKILAGGVRAEQQTTIQVAFPPSMLPIALQSFSKIKMESVSFLSVDKGLEDFTTTFSIGLGMEIIAKGYREKNAIRIHESVYNQKEKIHEERTSFEIGDVSIPTLSPSPFNDRPSIKAGDTWEIPVLNTTNKSGVPHLTSIQARVVGRESMHYHGKTVYVFKVEAGEENGHATAHFSLDGRVLKESWKLGELLDVTLIRDPHDQD